jgi:hypothetical protein
MARGQVTADMHLCGLGESRSLAHSVTLPDGGQLPLDSPELIRELENLYENKLHLMRLCLEHVILWMFP